jgi:hypothetical protein
MPVGVSVGQAQVKETLEPNGAEHSQPAQQAYLHAKDAMGLPAVRWHRGIAYPGSSKETIVPLVLGL